jgi:hypothetical protein
MLGEVFQNSLDREMIKDSLDRVAEFAEVIIKIAD